MRNIVRFDRFYVRSCFWKWPVLQRFQLQSSSNLEECMLYAMSSPKYCYCYCILSGYIYWPNRQQLSCMFTTSIQRFLYIMLPPGNEAYVAASGQSMDYIRDQAAPKTPPLQWTNMWRCFRPWPDNVVLCKLCKLKIGYLSSPTALHKHLERKILEHLAKIGVTTRQPCLFCICPRPSVMQV